MGRVASALLAAALAAGPAVAEGSSWAPRPDDHAPPARPLEDPSGRALDGFYAALAAVDDQAPRALVRVTHLGDSSIGADGLPHAIRRRFQARFGDGGPGYVLLERYSLNYASQTVALSTNGSWDHCYIAFLCAGDGRYGLGGVSFTSRGGARTTLQARDRRTFSRAELYFATGPESGRIELRIGDARYVIDGRAPAPGDGWHAFMLDPPARELRLRASGGGEVRAYGVVLETDGPGVVWDGLSMVGTFTRRLYGWNESHLADQVAHRDPDLLVLSYGGNDLRRVAVGHLDRDQYARELSHAIARLRAGKPGLSCLVTAVIDHGRSGKRDISRRHVETIVEGQRAAAVEQGCAFFDTYRAMGGPGSIERWRDHAPALAEPDLKHLNFRGRDRMGEMIYRALLSGYVGWRTARESDALPAGSTI